jgi:hypothetical protein
VRPKHHSPSSPVWHGRSESASAGHVPFLSLPRAIVHRENRRHHSPARVVHLVEPWIIVRARGLDRAVGVEVVLPRDPVPQAVVPVLQDYEAELVRYLDHPAPRVVDVLLVLIVVGGPLSDAQDRCIVKGRIRTRNI